MINFVHAPVGAVLAVWLVGIGWPLPIVLLVVFLFHFVLDSIPHWEPAFPWPLRWHRVWPVLLDMILAVVIIAVLFGVDFWQNQIVILGAIAGIFPDLILGLEVISRKETWVQKLHRWVHPPIGNRSTKKYPFWIGIWPQVLVLVIVFVLWMF